MYRGGRGNVVVRNTHTARGDTMTKTTGKAAAAAAAKELLRDRIALVETLGAALDTHHAKQQAVTDAQDVERSAAEKARESFAAAQAGGWTTAELHRAGLHAPAAPRKRKVVANNGATTNGAGNDAAPAGAPTTSDEHPTAQS
jgi:hypothetical protein